MMRRPLDVEHLAHRLRGRRLELPRRRGKFLLLDTEPDGGLLVHLGMSGSLRLLPAASPPRTHDHVDVLFGEQCLRLHDPRRFGAMLWTEDDPLAHPRLRDLGPEPLSTAFDGAYLHAVARHRRIAIKALLMDGHVVVGVGNIYATEALFRAGIHPQRSCRRISRPRLEQLVGEVKAVLDYAIARGGTTLRDFVNESGEPGYFAQELFVYGRAGEPCERCGQPVERIVVGQRGTHLCPACQTL